MGLRKVGHYEEVLAAAIKDESHIAGIINPFLANAATRIIHSQDFQRVRDRLEDDLAQQTRSHIETQTHQHNVTNTAVNAGINRADLDYIVNNLQQPPPPPAPPPPSNDASADRERLVAELDEMARKRDDQSRREMVAAANAQRLAAQDVATPMQQIIREYHHTNTPIYVPTPAAPPREDISAQMRHTNQTFNQWFITQQSPLPERKGEIPIEYGNSQGPPPPPPGGERIKSGYGPAKIKKDRLTPFTGSSGPPPAPGGATAPMVTPRALPVQEIDRSTRPLKKKKPQEITVTPVAPGPPPAPAPAPAVRVSKRGAEGSLAADIPQFRRFPGRGQMLPDDGGGFRGPSMSARALGGGAKRGGMVTGGFQAFTGRSQKLPDEHALRENARKRMQELGHSNSQGEKRAAMGERMGDLARAVRRGGATGDVVGPGKRKREGAGPGFVPRRRVGERAPGPQTFTIG